jgi:hypothetical protein
MTLRKKWFSILVPKMSAFINGELHLLIGGVWVSQKKYMEEKA